MAIRRSTGLVNALSIGYGVRELLRDSVIYLYSGSQPTSADVAPTGTLLCTFTSDGLAYVDPTRSFATLSIGGAAVGACSAITVGGMVFNLLSEPVSFNGTTAQTAIDVANNINARQNPLNIYAEASSSDVLLKAPYWLGAMADGLTFAATVSGSMTVTPSGIFSGGVTALNGLNFGEAVANGSTSKNTSVWQGAGLASGVAGYFRFVAGGSTKEGVSNLDIRFDGTAGTSGADMIISSSTIAVNSVYTISEASITESQE